MAPNNNHFFVLLFSMMLAVLGASAAAGEYYSRSEAGEVSKPDQPKVQSGSYDKPPAQSMPKPEESTVKPTFVNKDPKSESYNDGPAKKPVSAQWEKPTFGKVDLKASVSYGEPKFQYGHGPFEKPDFHFRNMPRSKTDYESYDKPTVAQWVPKPEESWKPTLGNDPKSAKPFDAEPVKKPDSRPAVVYSESYDKPTAQSVPKPEEADKPYNKPTAQSVPKPEEAEKPYNKPAAQPKPEESAKPYNKPATQSVPKPEESEKPMSEKDPKSKSYDEPKFQHNEPIEKPDSRVPNMPKAEPTKPVETYNTKPTYKADPHYETPKITIPKLEEAFPAAVEGIVICKSASGYVPIKGAVVRITCMEVDEEGYDKYPVSCQTHPTDAKGYFFKILPSNLMMNANKSWENCKAFLEQSPLEECGVPSNVNKGIDGYSLSTHHILQDKHLKLFPIAPFFYTPEPIAAKPAEIKKAPADAGGY